MALLISVLTFVVVTVLFLAIWMLATSDTQQDMIRRRMDAVRKAERRGDPSLGLTLARDEMLSSVPTLNRLMQNWAWSVRLQDYIGLVQRRDRLGRLRDRWTLLSAIPHCRSPWAGGHWSALCVCRMAAHQALTRI